MQPKATRVFDAQHYERLNASRAEVVSHLLAEIKQPLNLRTAVDVACGLGYFSNVLNSLGLDVVAVDGRQDNVDEALRRHPDIRFERYDAEDPELRTLGSFDLVFCFGLLYHLENPLLTVRHLYAMTEKLLLAEAVIFPGDEPAMALIDEEMYDDQGLNHIAFYPTEACLIKMLYRVGFSSVYQFVQQPDHSDYRETSGSRRVRTILAAAPASVSSPQLVLAPEPSSPIRPWDATSGVSSGNAAQRLKRFAEKPLPEKLTTLKRIIKGR